MTRFHHTATGQVAFTPAEEAEWDAMQAAAVLPSALARFQAKRDQIVNTGVIHDGNRWHTDPLSQHAMATAVVLAQAYEAATGQAWSTEWKTLTGFVSVTLPDIVTAGLVVGAHVQACFARENALIEQATGGDVPGAMAAINTGWPQ